MKTLSTAVLTGALLFAFSGASLAAQAGASPQAATTMTSASVKANLEAAGYTNVHEVKHEGKHFDAEAMKDGKKVHLHVDANNGAITPAAHADEEHEKGDDDDHDEG